MHINELLRSFSPSGYEHLSVNRFEQMDLCGIQEVHCIIRFMGKGLSKLGYDGGRESMQTWNKIQSPTFPYLSNYPIYGRR